MNFTRNARELQTGKKNNVTVIGLTGGIASGKTEATQALRKVGYTVIDADEVSRELFAFGTDGEQALLLAFPQACEKGKLNRAALRRIISTDCAARIRLNEITHPAITAHIKRLISTKKPPVILSAPLLFESALSSLCDVTVCVYAPRALRIKRLMSRDGISAADAVNIIDAQIPDTERCTMSDYIVPSDRDKAEFISEITELIQEILR
ncbi:MAG: dephospho-CoA kinase [Clostridiales bacterium]|nr:dephospho-CoA kinase [Clostridiales bacterium]